MLLKRPLKKEIEVTERFGNTWEFIGNKVVTRVGAIDNGQALRVGLSAMQLTNRGIEGDGNTYYYGVIGARRAGMLNVARNALVYNAWGRIGSSHPRETIRISSALAKELKLEVGDIVVLKAAKRS